MCIKFYLNLYTFIVLINEDSNSIPSVLYAPYFMKFWVHSFLLIVFAFGVVVCGDFYCYFFNTFTFRFLTGYC